jgi:hypothetical protein
MQIPVHYDTNILQVSSQITSESCKKFPVSNELFSHVSLTDEERDFNVSMGQYMEDVVAYIAGFVVRKLKKAITCEIWASVLYNDCISNNSLINIKNRGGLVLPSDDVVTICKYSERMCLKIFNLTKHNSPSIDYRDL